MITSVQLNSVSGALQRKLLLVTGLLSTAFFVTDASAQSVVYRETFYTTSSTANRLNDASPALGWHFDRALTLGGTVSSGDGLSTRSNGTGKPDSLPAINAGSYAGTDLGIIFTTPGDARQGLFYTNEYTSLLSQNISQISWYAGNGSTAPTQQVAVQVGGTWYISSTTFTTAGIGGTAFATSSEQKTLNFSGATWNTLTYTSGSTGFSISGTSTVLPTGAVSGFGLFVDTAGSANIRFDTFEITAIPEPSTSALIGGSCGLLALGFYRFKMGRKKSA